MRFRTIPALALLASTPFAAQEEAAAPASLTTAPARSAELARGEVANERFVHYDARTGKITVDSQGPVLARGAGTTVTFDNFSGAIQYYLQPAAVGTELGQDNFGDITPFTLSRESGVVSSMRFRYASRAQDPSSGGPGASVEVSLQGSGWLTIDPVRGVLEEYRETISGLPTGNPTQLTGLPTLTVWNLTVTPSTPVCHAPLVAASSLGWTFKHIDADTFPVVQTTVGNQVLEEYGVYDCTGFLSGLDSLAPNESFAFELSEYVLYPGSPQVIGSAPAPGYGELSASDAFIDFTPFSETLSCSGATPSLALYQIYLGPALGTPLPSKWGDIWVDVSRPRVVKLLQPHGGGSVTFDLGTIPPDYSLQGTRFTSQGFCGDSPQGVLSNAVQHTIGARCF